MRHSVAAEVRNHLPAIALATLGLFACAFGIPAAFRITGFPQPVQSALPDAPVAGLVLFIVFRAPMIALFLDEGTPPDVAARVVALGSSFLIATATFQAFDAGAMICSGGLRGAGDTVVPGIVTVALAWTVIVGGGTALVHFAPELESLGPWMAAASYIISLSLFLLFR